MIKNQDLKSSSFKPIKVIFYPLKSSLFFFSFCTIQKITRGMRLIHFFPPLIPFQAQISSFTEPTIIQLISNNP